MQVIESDPIEIIPDEGMCLVNLEGVYSDGPVYLGKFDIPSNWMEVSRDSVAELLAEAEESQG